MSALKKLFSLLTHFYDVYQYKRMWRRNNEHNCTAAGTNINGKVYVGKHTYGVISVPYSGGKIRIGSFCSIADNVSFLSAGEHYTDHLSTFPFDAYVMHRNERGGVSKGDIVICDDVWIGYGATILSGVTIGQGAIIGAGTVVAKDVPPYAVFAGGRIIKYRFDEDTISALLQFDYSSLTEKEIKQNIELLYTKIDKSFFSSDFYLRHKK